MCWWALGIITLGPLVWLLGRLGFLYLAIRAERKHGQGL